MNDAPMTPALDARAFGDADELRGHVLEELRRAMGWDLTFLTRIDGEQLEVIDIAGDRGWIAPGTVLPLEDAFCERLVGGAPPCSDRLADPAGPYGAVAHTALALGAESYSGHIVHRRDGSVYGTLCALDRGAKRPTADQRKLGETFSRLLAWELERSQLVDELNRLANTDGLTGLASRRAFFAGLAGEVERARRHGRRLSFVIMDLDNFKRVNDSHGHPAGDRALTAVAAILREATRAGELLGRLGGEEFGWALPETDALGAWQAADRVRGQVAEAAILPDEYLSLSAGIADLSQAGNGEELYRLADRALYRAKTLGRNQCVRYSRDSPGVLSPL